MKQKVNFLLQVVSIKHRCTMKRRRFKAKRQLANKHTLISRRQRVLQFWKARAVLMKACHPYSKCFPLKI